VNGEKSPPASGRSVGRTAFIVAAMTLVSRVGGLIREQLMGYFFGTGMEKSALDVAFRIPNLFRRLFGEGALSAALIPVYTETLRNDGKAEADRLAAGVAGTMVGFLSLVTVAGIALTYPLARLLKSGLLQNWPALARHFPLDDRWEQILTLLRILFPYAPLICLAALIMGVLNSLKSFAIPALAPAFLNLCWILALVFVCPFLPAEGNSRIQAVAWAILLSGVVQVAVQLPVLAKHGVPRRLLFGMTRHPKVRRVFRLMFPMAIAAGVVQVNVCLDSFLAMVAGEWGPSVLGFADRLIYFPLAIFGTAFATVLLPTFSSSAAAGDFQSFHGDLQRSMATMCAILLPSTAGLMALAVPLVSLIYEMGAFDALSTTRTARALLAYAVGLVAAGGAKIAPQAFYALKETKTPVNIGLGCVGLNLFLNLFFLWILPFEWKPIGIAFATSISSFVQCVVLLHLLSRREYGSIRLFRWKPFMRPFLSSLAASAGMGVCTWKGYGWIGRAVAALLPAAPGKLLEAIAVAAAIGAAVALYSLLLYLLCPSLLRDAAGMLRRRKRRPPPS
jgi:putative peptidoglycan lipid II flippase